MTYSHLSYLRSLLISLLFAATYTPHSLALQLCDASDGTQYSGQYADGSGVYITSSDPERQADLLHKCWYEYFLLTSSLYNAAWRKSSGDIECAGTSHCTVSLLNGTQFCQTRTDTISAEISIDTEFFHASLGYSVSLSEEGCYSATNTNACEWDDGGCHNVWTQQQLVKQLGYKKRVCDGLYNNDKKVTKCMADFETDTPTTFTNYGCSAACNATYNGTGTANAPSVTTTAVATGVSSSSSLLVCRGVISVITGLAILLLYVT